MSPATAVAERLRRIGALPSAGQGTQRLVDLRCTAPHPKSPPYRCRAKVADVIEGSVTMQRGSEIAAGAVVIRCRRCMTHWTLRAR